MEDRSQSGGPRHVAVIMDGNGRWAQARGRSRQLGHDVGAKRVNEVVRACPDLGIDHLTLFAFSTENWKRPQAEVAGLMGLFRRYLMKEMTNFVSEGLMVRFVGDRRQLDAKLSSLMDEAEQRTRDCDGPRLTVALNYGGRDEIARVARGIAADAAGGRLDPEDVDEREFERRLDTFPAPHPDLVIRTGGETRISNFLLWQCAYAEFEFVDTLWPDFTAQRFAAVVERYGARERRYGAVMA